MMLPSLKYRLDFTMLSLCKAEEKKPIWSHVNQWCLVFHRSYLCEPELFCPGQLRTLVVVSNNESGRLQHSGRKIWNTELLLSFPVQPLVHCVLSGHILLKLWTSSGAIICLDTFRAQVFKF